MIDERCLAEDVDRSRIDPTATVGGASYLSGPETAVGPGAVVRDARLHNVAVGEAATVKDSILVAEGEPETHKCDAAGRVVVGGVAAPKVGARARVEGSTLVNCGVEADAEVVHSWLKDVVLGPRAVVREAKVALTHVERDARILGPTEVSEARVGYGATLDRRGYFEGVFSNTFRQVRFDEAEGRLRVTGTLVLPHLSLYGVNTVNSTNSGKLLPQPEEGIRDFGPHKGLWSITLLSHEQIELGPCCWVAPWTKIIGQSSAPHFRNEDIVNDRLMTYVMPFAIAGVDGPSSNGLVMPGELSVGYGPKKRRPAWVFTYAPDLVIRMVKRLGEALEPRRRHVADTIVVEAIRVALEMTRALAHEYGVDLGKPAGEQRRGWPRWIAEGYALLAAHLDSGMWEFRNGEPVGWQWRDGRWRHPYMRGVLELAPDALDAQRTEEDIFAFDDPVPPLLVPAAMGSFKGSGGEPIVSDHATIAEDAFIGPGCMIGPHCEVGSGAVLWNSQLDDAWVAAGARVERSVLDDASVGAGAVVRSCLLDRATLGAGSDANAAWLINADLSDCATVGAFADIRNTRSAFPAILGGAFADTEIDTVLMSMHLCGDCRGLKAAPTPVELDGAVALVHAVPMIGGGAVIRGTAEDPVVMECAFIGSNSFLEGGCYVGFGCFVLGTLGPDDGLLPFTMTSKAGPRHHQIGGVLADMANMIFTHFVDWAFQALGPDSGPGLAEMTRQSAELGARAVEWELERREAERPFDEESPFVRFKSLPAYSEGQLKTGLANYRTALDQGAWDMAFDGERLAFTGTGRWIERNGGAHWEAD